MSTGPAFAVLVLTEDGSEHAFATVRAVGKKLLRQVDDRCQTHKIDFTPANDEARKILAGNQFRGRRHPHRRRMYQLVAAQLRLSDGFVFHHVDADMTWSDPRRASTDPAAVEAELLAHVEELLRMNGVDDEAIAEMRSRFLRLVPYWELEAWLYQNADRAAALCPGPPHCRRDCRTRLAAWAADRTLLDEEKDPSDQLCFGKRHNLDLVEGLPAAAMYGAGKSFAAAVDGMFACDPLLRAIERTYSSLAPSGPGTAPTGGAAP